MTLNAKEWTFNVKRVQFSGFCGNNLYENIGFPAESKREIVRTADGREYYLIPYRRSAWADSNDGDWERAVIHSHWDKVVKNPVNARWFIWPVDLIAERQGLVFPRYGRPPMRKLKDLFEELENEEFDELRRDVVVIDWQKPRNARIIINLLHACCALGGKGYAHHELNDENIYLVDGESPDVLIDFSMSLQADCTDCFRQELVEARQVENLYLEPWFFLGGKRRCLDLASEWFSVAAIIFRLMIGRLPYQDYRMESFYGDLKQYQEYNIEIDPDTADEKQLQMDNIVKQGLESYIREYHKNPTYIFNRDSGGKTIPMVGKIEYRKYNEAHKALTQNLQDMFYETFRLENAERTNEKLIRYTPDDWLAEINKLFSAHQKIQLKEV